MNTAELNNRRLAAICGMNPYSPIFNSQHLQVRDELKTFELSPEKSGMFAPENSSADIHTENEMEKQ